MSSFRTAWTGFASLTAILACATACTFGGGEGAPANESEGTPPTESAPAGAGQTESAAPTCNPKPRAPDPVEEPVAVPKDAPTDFVSADTPYYRDMFAGEEEEEEEEEEEREVEEGDIYRVLGDGYMLDANRNAGLEIIDIRDPAKPAIAGRLKVVGTPVEMYAVGDRVVVLLNDWTDYELKPSSIDVTARSGGTGLLVDVSDRKAPRLLSQFHVDGRISSSRLAHSEGSDSLYVASAYYGYLKSDAGGYTWQVVTAVTSFDIGKTEMSERGRLSLGGYVTAINAQSNTLLVARDRRTWTTTDGEVGLVDISASDGTMVLRDSIPVTGFVRSQFHMDLRNGILRVVSGPHWGTTPNSLQTFDVATPGAATLIDHVDFSNGEQVYGSVFLDDRAFVVTYRRTDPFHAFAIDSTGHIAEKSRFVVSGWNDFFKPVLNSSRLIGIGVDDTDGRKVAVSLYDITDLENAKPLIARTTTEDGGKSGWSWSEASWDHRAFSVLENAVDVAAPTGEREHGLVLLPFTGGTWDSGTNRSGVQIFTFSATTVTRRGVMDSLGWVRRSFRLDDHKGANLSDEALSIYDESDVDHPTELGRVDLAPGFESIYAFGDYRVRVVNSAGDSTHAAGLRGEVIPAKGQADIVAPIASFPLPYTSRLYQVGDQLVALTWNYESSSGATMVTVVDLSCPTAPRVLPSFATHDLPQPSTIVTPDYRYIDGTLVTRDAIAFVHTVDATDGSSHMVHSCGTQLKVYPSCYYDGSDCSYLEGTRTCVEIDGKPSYCTGGFARCTRTASTTTCTTDADKLGPPAATLTTCTDWSYPGYSQQFEVTVLDLTHPWAPTVSNRIVLRKDEEGVSAITDGRDVILTVRRPATSADGRPAMRYFARRVDLAVPSKPVLGDEINVPGEVIDAHGNTLVSRDKRWGSQYAETVLARTVVDGGKAYLTNYHPFTDRAVDGIVVGDHRLSLVTSDLAWPPRLYYVRNTDRTLRILDLDDGAETGGPFAVRFDGQMTLSSPGSASRWNWGSSLVRATHGRAFVGVPYGLLMLDVSEPASPYAQAYFPGGTADVLFDHGEVLDPAGVKGIHQLAIGGHVDAPTVLHTSGYDTAASVASPWRFAPKKKTTTKKKNKKVRALPTMPLAR